MASANFMKATVQTLSSGGMRAHFDNERRTQLNHSNTDINKTLTLENYYIGCDSYQDMLNKAKNRIEYLDREHPPKRLSPDRKTCCMVEIPCPLDIEKDGNADLFMQKGYEALCEHFGRENVAGLAVHKDEKHTYIDKDGCEKESLYHMHALVVAHAKWHDKDGSEREGCNMKHFETKEMLREFNKRMHTMCQHEFNRDFNTHNTALNKTVEELKAISYDSALKKEHERVKKELERSESKCTKLAEDVARLRGDKIKQEQLRKTVKSRKMLLSKDKQVTVGVDMLQAMERYLAMNRQIDNAEMLESKASNKLSQAEQMLEDAKKQKQLYDSRLQNLDFERERAFKDGYDKGVKSANKNILAAIMEPLFEVIGKTKVFELIQLGREKIKAKKLQYETDDISRDDDCDLCR